MADTRDFLLEIGCEEMPSAPLMNAQAQLGKLFAAGLDAAGLAHGAIRTLSTPRRLAVIAEACATSTEEVRESGRGPAAQIAFDADGNPTKAALGFARKMGVDPSELLRKVGPDGREYVFAEKVIPARDATPLLSELAERTIAGLTWPNYRSQRWGSEHATFVRPIRWICALLGSEVVPVSYADVTSGNTTRGHRVLAPGAHVVPSADAYEQVLEDMSERKAGAGAHAALVAQVELRLAHAVLPITEVGEWSFLHLAVALRVRVALGPPDQVHRLAPWGVQRVLHGCTSPRAASPITRLLSASCSIRGPGWCGSASARRRTSAPGCGPWRRW